MTKLSPVFCSRLIRRGGQATLAAALVAMTLQAPAALAAEEGSSGGGIPADLSEMFGPRLTATEAAQPAETGQEPTVHSAPGARFHIGDRLQIDFFEHIDLGQSGSGVAGMNSSMRTFYQRLDLTGQYSVDVDGAIAIPLLGRFAIEGRSVEDLRDEIKAAFETETGRGGDIHIAITERQPVFVTGVVRNPGSYGFVPGMIALQAIALAGGMERLPEGSSQMLEMLRERERHAQAVQRLKRLTAQRARLMEERDGTPSGEALLADASDEVRPLLGAERMLLEAEAAAQQSELDLQDAMLASAEGELVALRESVGLVERQIDVRSERMQVLQQMQGRGIVNLEVMWGAQKDVTDFELQREQLATAIHLAEQKVAQAELAREKVGLDHRARIARELAEVDDEIAQVESTIAASQDMVRTLETVALRGVARAEEIEIEILRRTANGVTTLPANEGSDLMPGDVVKVQANGAPRQLLSDKAF